MFMHGISIIISRMYSYIVFPISGPDETSMSSISSDKMPKSEVDGSESSQPVRQETSKSVYEYEDPEDDFLSDYNISDDEFTPSRRKKRKEPPAKKVPLSNLLYSTNLVYLSAINIHKDSSGIWQTVQFLNNNSLEKPLCTKQIEQQLHMHAQKVITKP